MLIFPLRYNLRTIAKNSNDLSIGFDRDRDRRQRELTNVVAIFWARAGVICLWKRPASG